MSSSLVGPGPRRLRCAVVLRVEEHACEVWIDGSVASVAFAPIFPTPRAKRVSPGHLVAVAPTANGGNRVVWRWFDVVVLGSEAEGIRLWEPAHGEVLAGARESYREREPGSRAYASAGLPGSEWWVAGPVVSPAEDADVDLDAVVQMYTDNGLWPVALETGQDVGE